MKNITQTELLKTILPKEIAEEYKLEEIIDTEKYIEFVMIEINHLPKNEQYRGENIEIKKYNIQQLLTFPLKGKQCRIKLKKKRWIMKKTRKTIISELKSKTLIL